MVRESHGSYFEHKRVVFLAARSRKFTASFLSLQYKQVEKIHIRFKQSGNAELARRFVYKTTSALIECAALDCYRSDNTSFIYKNNKLFFETLIVFPAIDTKIILPVYYYRKANSTKSDKN